MTTTTMKVKFIARLRAEAMRDLRWHRRCLSEAKKEMKALRRRIRVLDALIDNPEGSDVLRPRIDPHL